MASPLLIGLPQGLNVSGVTVWAARLAGAVAEAGRPAALLLHREPPGHERLDLNLHPGVERIDLTDLPALEAARGDLAPFIDRYQEVVWRLADAHGSPVVLSPNLHGDCYGIAAALCLAGPERLRVVGWVHSDIDYNYRVMARYEPVLSRLVAVSNHIEAQLKRRLPDRAGDIDNIPYGVPIAPAAPRREPLSGRPVRLVYTGRIDHHQKRIMALADLARELDRRGVDHELVVVGDGPAVPEFDEAIHSARTVRRRPPTGTDGIGRLLEQGDALVLASRYEGLSISMLEAMARGCVPIVTRVHSGVEQAVQNGHNGELADTSPGDDEATVAVALADAVERFLAGDLASMAESAWRTARGRFSMERHAGAVAAMLDEVTAGPPRTWPADRPCAFTAADASGASGSVPADGAARLASVLERLGGRRIVLHGTGQHTRQLAHVLAGSPARIVALADDDRQQHGSTLLEWPVVAPREAGATGATDVVISSWINQDVIWSRRRVYERQGLTVHRLYD
ncbi:MAG: glycosyltransferase family 4 protein [Planctomycetota bacterium]|jgi:glycosyltransferase involved in cell wall biosynthesis